MISTSATKRSVRRLSPRSTVPKFMKPTDCSVSSMLCPLRTERGYPPRSAPKFGCAGQVQRRQDLPNCKNFRQDLTTMLKITVDNILTKHELQVRQPVVFVTSGCSDVVKLEGEPHRRPSPASLAICPGTAQKLANIRGIEHLLSAGVGGTTHEVALLIR